MANKSRYRSLTRSADFQALKKSGHVVHVNAWLLVNWRRANETHIRCGWTIPGHIGSAVLRNKFKRWGREYLKKWSALSTLAEGLDMNMILKRRPDGFYRELTHKDFDEAMSRATAKLR